MTELERPPTIERRIEADPEFLRILDEAPGNQPMSTKHALALTRLARVYGLSIGEVHGWMIEKRIERQPGKSDDGEA